MISCSPMHTSTYDTLTREPTVPRALDTSTLHSKIRKIDSAPACLFSFTSRFQAVEKQNCECSSSADAQQFIKADCRSAREATCAWRGTVQTTSKAQALHPFSGEPRREDTAFRMKPRETVLKQPLLTVSENFKLFLIEFWRPPPRKQE